jgi:translocation-and-assembly-module (TAM) inner membrane subunit TamB-like protein
LNVGAWIRRPIRAVGDLGRRRAVQRTPIEAKPTGIALFKLDTPPLASAKFDVAVDAKRPIEVRSNVFHGMLRPRVRLRGTGTVPIVVGDVYVDRLFVTLPASRVRFGTAVVRFDEQDPFFPQLDMLGSTRVAGYDVQVVVSGPFNSPTVVLSSTPPLPPDQLALLVTLGQVPPSAPGATTTTPGTTIGTTNAGAGAADQRVLVNVASFVGSDLMRKLFGIGDDDAAGEILDRFEVTAGRNTSRTGTDTWEATFRVGRGLITPRSTLLLAGERDEFGHYDVGVRVVFRGD